MQFNCSNMHDISFQSVAMRSIRGSEYYGTQISQGSNGYKSRCGEILKKHYIHMVAIPFDIIGKFCCSILSNPSECNVGLNTEH